MQKFEKKEIIGIASLLIHAAKIDEMYSENEKKIILSFIENNLDNNSSSKDILKEAEELEAKSNQLINYTKIIKDSSTEIKSKITLFISTHISHRHKRHIRLHEDLRHNDIRDYILYRS